MAKAAGTAKEGKAKGYSLETIYQEIEKLLGPYAPPLKALSGGVKGKSCFRVKKLEEGLKKIPGRRWVPA